MKVLNNHTQIKQIDNTKTGTIMDGVESKGYYSSRLMMSNMGEVVSSELFAVGDIVVYMSSTDYIYKEHLFIKDCAVFLVNGDLVGDGVIVDKATFEQRSTDHFSLRKMEFFVVTQSRVEDVVVDDVVTIRPRACTRFNVDTKEYFFVPTASIVLVINAANGIVAGPEFQKIRVTSNTEFGIDIEDKLMGFKDGQMVYFNDAEFRVTIAGEDYHIVRNDCVYRIG